MNMYIPESCMTIGHCYKRLNGTVERSPEVRVRTLYPKLLSRHKNDTLLYEYGKTSSTSDKRFKSYAQVYFKFSVA